MAVLSCLLRVFVSEVVRGVWENVKDRASILPAPALIAWLFSEPTSDARKNERMVGGASERRFAGGLSRYFVAVTAEGS
jgi:hypothetical protein